VKQKNNRNVNGKIWRFHTRAKNFTNVLSYIGKKNFCTYPGTTISATFLLLLTGALQVLALLLMTTLLGDNDGLAVGGSALAPITRWIGSLPISFLGMVFIITAILLTASYCTYSGECKVLKMAANLELELTKDLFVYLGTAPGMIKLIKNKFSPEYLFRVTIASTRLSARIMRLQFNLIPSLLKSIALFIGLLIIDWAMTLAVLGFMFLLGIIQYNINLRAVKYSLAFENSSATARQILKAKLDTVLLSLGGANKASSDFLQEESIVLNKDNFQMRFQVKEESRLFSSVSKAVIIFFIIATITEFGELQSKALLANLLIYAFALYMFVLSLQSVLMGLTGISRFYPQVNRYFRLLYEPSSAMSRDLTEYSFYIPIKLTGGVSRKVYLSDATCLFIVTPIQRVEKDQIALLCSIGIETGSPHASVETIKENSEKKSEPLVSEEYLLPFTISDSTAEALEIMGDKQNRFKIIYIRPAIALELNGSHSLYEYSRDTSQLVPWSRNSIKSDISYDDNNDDELDDL
jgi:ABC-type multidrug transport system fused ATPase/permease subunit